MNVKFFFHPRFLKLCFPNIWYISILTASSADATARSAPQPRSESGGWGFRLPDPYFQILGASRRRQAPQRRRSKLSVRRRKKNARRLYSSVVAIEGVCSGGGGGAGKCWMLRRLLVQSCANLPMAVTHPSSPSALYTWRESVARSTKPLDRAPPGRPRGCTAKSAFDVVVMARFRDALNCVCWLSARGANFGAFLRICKDRARSTDKILLL